MGKTVSEINSVVQTHLNTAADGISKSLDSIGTEEVEIERPTYLVRNKFWDKWLQKLLAQAISVKVWGLVIITVLISMGFITGSEFIIGFSLIVGAKGGKDIVMKWMDTKSNNDMIDKV